MSLHNIVMVAAITLFIYWTLGTALYWATGENDTFAAHWCMGLVYWVLYILFLPVRLVRKHRYRR
jgi:hypothetical protein